MARQEEPEYLSEGVVAWTKCPSLSLGYELCPWSLTDTTLLKKKIVSKTT